MKTLLKWVTPNGEALIAEIARVSNPGNQDNPDYAKLLSYMVQHNHWSPFEMVSACFEINTTRDIGRQILRHRSFSFQEFSQRYAAVNALPPAELRECRTQDAKNRQNSIVSDDCTLDAAWEALQRTVESVTAGAYRNALEMGIAKEQARALLPEGLTPSRIYMSGTLRSWMHYCKLRTGVETQKEHREIAAEISDTLRQCFPLVWAAL